MRYTAVFIILMLLSIVNSPYQDKNFSPIIYGFEKSGIKLEKYNISGQVSFKAEDSSIADTANKILKTIKLYIDNSQMVMDNTTDGIIYFGKYSDGHITVTLRFYEESDECAAIIDVEQKSDLSSCVELRNMIEASLENLGEKPEIKLCITGYKEGKDDSRNVRLENIIKSTGADCVEQIQDNNLTSISGYSSKIEDSILCDGRKINVNTASRYDSYNDKTVFLVASPLIDIEY